ncbi:MAG: MarR family transcriptional regulator [Kofleriaceae bacterium]
MQRLWAVAHALDVRSKRMERALGVTGPQRLVLRIVGQRPGITAGDLARSLDLHASTLTGILARLVSHKLLSRTTDPADRRRARFALTSAGRRVDAVRTGTVEASITKALAQASDADVEACQRLLASLAAVLTSDVPERKGSPRAAPPRKRAAARKPPAERRRRAGR